VIILKSQEGGPDGNRARVNRRGDTFEGIEVKRREWNVRF